MKIEMSQISKSFGENQVLSGVNFTVESGQVHALMGENGAGKSTLMNILTGIHKANGGKILIDGEEINFKNARQAEDNGIAFIHQELNIWPNLTILENLFLTRPIKNSFGCLNKKAMREKAEKLCADLHITLPLDKLASECSIGQQQLTEIVRVVMLHAKVVIMDEPTAALTERETKTLFKVMKSMQARGVAIIYISHRMEEVFSECNVVSVMRDGKLVSTKKIAEATIEGIVKDMVGRSITEYYPQRSNKPGKVLLEVKELQPKTLHTTVSFDLRKGEILGVSGLMGAGRTEIMRTVFGLDKKDGGKIYLDGQEICIKKPSDAIAAGIGFVTEDRKSEGLILDFSINDNIALPNVESFCPGVVIRDKKEHEFTRHLFGKLGIKAHSLFLPVKALSGGNQQKVVLAKWIGLNPRILIMDEPTRGIDVGAKRDIYDLMNELTAQGVSIIMVSSELPEIIGMSDRVMVVHEGKLAGILTKEEATQERIITLATGGI